MDHNKVNKVWAVMGDDGEVTFARNEISWGEEIEVGEATLASWEHAVEMYYRMQDEIEDMVYAKRQAQRSV
jgi:hypothetical protein